MKTLTIAIGADQLGFPLKEELLRELSAKGYLVEDFGVRDGEDRMYPEVGYRVASAVARGAYSRGILVCGTGIGMCITANKVAGIRAAVCHDIHSAERSRKSNDCQVLALGAQIIGADFAKSLVSIWLNSEFQFGCSCAKVDRIMEIESEIGMTSVYRPVLHRIG